MESSKNLIILSLLSILSLNLISAQVTYQCASTTPTTETDCFNASTDSSEYCCYLTGINSYANEKLCLNVPHTTYTGETKYAYNNKVYNIACDFSEKTTILEKCSGEPTSKKGCSKGSSFTNSCCYYEKTETESTNEKVQNTDTGCYWLGTKYSGEITWAGLNLSCKENFLTYSFSLVFLFFIFLL
jgi:hypothetical protein